MTLLCANDVHKRFGELPALEHVDLMVEPRQFHGLIGPNGSGKSTLLKCIAGAEIADKGSIVFQDQDITGASAAWRARRRMSLKFQITSVFNQLSVYDNILLSLQADGSMWGLIRSRSRRDLHPRVMKILDQFNLTARTDDLAGELSHGEQQWLEIAIALARDPKLLLLDEPTAGMTEQETQKTSEIFNRLKGERSLVVVEHDMAFVREIADVITLMHLGQTLAEGPMEEVENDMKNAFQR